jgi:hypothetical protein
MPAKQSSSRLSRIASKYVRLSPKRLQELLFENESKTMDDIRSLAASVLSQDEVNGK